MKTLLTRATRELRSSEPRRETPTIGISNCVQAPILSARLSLFIGARYVIHASSLPTGTGRSGDKLQGGLPAMMYWTAR